MLLDLVQMLIFSFIEKASEIQGIRWNNNFFQKILIKSQQSVDAVRQSFWILEIPLVAERESEFLTHKRPSAEI